MIRISKAYQGKWLIGRGDPNFSYYRTTGVMHMVESVIIRWRGMGGALDRPNISVISHCGRQEDLNYVSAYPTSDNVRHPLAAFGICARCEKRVQKLLDNQRQVT